MRQVSVVLSCTKHKRFEVKFESSQHGGPLGFLYLRKQAYSDLGMPRAITVTLEPCPTTALQTLSDADLAPRLKEPSRAEKTKVPTS